MPRDTVLTPEGLEELKARIEHLRGVSEFDPKVTKQPTRGAGDAAADDDGDGAAEKLKAYAADEEHAMQLISFDNVKNAWARSIPSRS